MLIALLFLAGATFAWFAISTAPEISGISVSIGGAETILLALDNPDVINKNTLDYRTTVSLNDIFSSYTALTPVSTADLVNWYLPTYDLQTGNLNPASEFILDNSLTFANKYRYKTMYGKIVYAVDGQLTTENVTSSGRISLDSAAMLTGYDLFTAESSGMYVYADVWMKTTAEEGCDVRLSFPHYGVETAANGNEMDGFFGTYVLPKLGIATDEDTGEETLRSLSNNAETSVRIGMQIFGNAVSENEAERNTVTEWYIYEPNADRRSNLNRKPVIQSTGMSQHVLDYRPEEILSGGYYNRTQPIGGGASPAVRELDYAHLITQAGCGWNLEDEALAETVRKGKLPNSCNLKYFGAFVPGAEIESAMNGSKNCAYPAAAPEDNCVSQVLFRLEYDKPVRIRFFVWIEGQDVDCWNDIASGDFMVNLEFAGS